MQPAVLIVLVIAAIVLVLAWIARALLAWVRRGSRPARDSRGDDGSGAPDGLDLDLFPSVPGASDDGPFVSSD